jgi:hydrogenase nickel incorporation protein HypA/HybF
MHELSIIHSIVEAVGELVAAEPEPVRVEAIDLEIGELSGVVIESIEFLWEAAVADTVLEGAAWRIHQVEGAAECGGCQQTFALHEVFAPCPHCGSFLKKITRGEALLIRSVALSAKETA